MGIFRRGMTAARLVPLLLLVGSAHAQDKDGCHNVCHVDKCKGTLTNPLPRGEQWKTKSVNGPKTCCAGSNEQCHVCCPSSSSGSSQPKANDTPKNCNACIAANTGALSAREAKKVWCTTDNTCLDGPSTAARSKCSNDGTLVWKSCPKKAEAAYSEAPKPPPAPPKAQPVLKGCDERSKAECEATPSLSKTKKCVWDATSDGYASCHAVSIEQSKPTPPPQPELNVSDTKDEPAKADAGGNADLACNKMPGMRSSTKEENQHCHQYKGENKCVADSQCRWLSLAAKSGGQKMCKPKCHREEGRTNATEENEPAEQEPAAQETNTTGSGDDTSSSSTGSGDDTSSSSDDVSNSEQTEEQESAEPPPPPQANSGQKGCFDRSKQECESSSGMSAKNKCVWDAAGKYCKAVVNPNGPTAKPKPCFSRSEDECTATPSPLRTKVCQWKNGSCSSVAKRRLI